MGGNASGKGVLTVLIALSVVATTPVGALPTEQSTLSELNGDDRAVERSLIGAPIGSLDNTSDDLLEDTGETVDDTSDVTDETTDTIDETVDDTTESTLDTTDEPTETVEGSTDDGSESVADTEEPSDSSTNTESEDEVSGSSTEESTDDIERSTEDTIEGVSDGAIDSTEDTTGATTDLTESVDDSSDDIWETADDGTDAVTETTQSTLPTADETAADTADAAGETINETTDLANETTESPAVTTDEAHNATLFVTGETDADLVDHPSTADAVRPGEAPLEGAEVETADVIGNDPTADLSEASTELLVNAGENSIEEPTGLAPTVLALKASIDAQTQSVTSALVQTIHTSLETLATITEDVTEPVTATLAGLTGTDDDSTSPASGGADHTDAASTEKTSQTPLTHEFPLSGSHRFDLPGPAETPKGGVALGIGALLLAAVARRVAITPTLLMDVIAPLGPSLSLLVPMGRGWRLRYWGWRIYSILRYSRYDDSDPLAHVGRSTLHDRIEESPGTHLSALSAETDIPLSTVRYHLRVLESEGLITSLKVNGKRRFYPARAEEREFAPAKDDAPAAVIETLDRHGPLTGSELATELDRDPSTVTYHLQRLADADLVERDREGRAVINRLAPKARTALTAESVDAFHLPTPNTAD